MNPWTVLEGDAITRLAELPAASFACCVTSPPYWQLRDYGTGTWEGGAAGCDHRQPSHTTRDGRSSTLTSVGARECVNDNITQTHARQYRDLCAKCGARRIDQQLGLERLPDCFAWARGVPRCGACYVCKMTDVFAAARRVLRDDGTLWVNCAGSYAQSTTRHRRSPATGWTDGGTGQAADGLVDNRLSSVVGGWKAKDYVNVPALLAESLRADGWYLRAEIALTKVAPMPESCRDRPTRATEKLYLFAKSGRYFYDGEAERPAAQYGRVEYPNAEARAGRQATSSAMFRGVGDAKEDVQGGMNKAGATYDPSAGRNLWDWWDDEDDDLPPAVWPWRPEGGTKSKHYATFPLWLPLRCVRLGTSAGGVCGACGGPWRRVVERKAGVAGGRNPRVGIDVRGGNQSADGIPDGGRSVTLGWQPSCKCPPSDPVPARVLDPFCGTATAGVAARLLGRHFTGIELSESYCRVSRERLAGAAPLDDAAWGARKAPPPPEPTLFGDQP